MRHFTVRQFAKACQAQYFGPEEVLEQEIHGVVIDNRQIEEGYLFAAVAGERVDGHTFIPSAFEKGAICALSEQKLENPSGPYLLVENTLQALKDADVLSEGASTVAYSYIGSELTYPIYFEGTIGAAKKHLHQTADEITKEVGVKALISVNKGLVTQASAAIPIVPLYMSVLYKVMKENNVHE